MVGGAGEQAQETGVHPAPLRSADQIGFQRITQRERHQVRPELVKLLGDKAHAYLDGKGQHPLAVGEIGVERADRYPRPFGDLLDVERRRTLVGGFVQDAGQDGLLAFRIEPAEGARDQTCLLQVQNVGVDHRKICRRWPAGDVAGAGAAVVGEPPGEPGFRLLGVGEVGAYREAGVARPFAGHESGCLLQAPSGRQSAFWALDCRPPRAWLRD